MRRRNRLSATPVATRWPRFFYGRRAVELLVNWLYDFDPAYTRPYDDSLNALLRDISLQRNVPVAVQNNLHLIRKEGNLAVHEHRQIQPATALGVMKGTLSRRPLVCPHLHHRRPQRHPHHL
ncbi:MAG: DUF4145 domain-containing protein [Caldilineaceae bacterium]